MERYDHGGNIYASPGVALDFSVNINPLGMPDEVRSALISHVDEYVRYPDPECRELRRAIALKENVPAGWIVCGNGAADLIYRLCHAVKPKNALLCSPTFSEYERALEQTGCHVAYHDLTSANEFAVTAGIENSLVPGIDILFLCNPNNPTGRLIMPDLLEHILAHAQRNGTIVIVDECFLDFTYGLSCKRYLQKTPGLVVLKAFTKMYGVAGLRLGYVLASDEQLKNMVANAGQCWSVSVPAQIAGTAALACLGWAEKTRRLVADERSFMSESLGRLGIKAFHSDANFLLLRSDHPLYDQLLSRGILIRKCENFRGRDESYVRIGVKTRLENIRFIEAVREIING